MFKSIAITSDKPIKVDAVKRAFPECKKVIGFATKAKMAEQPINENGLIGAEERIRWFIKNIGTEGFDAIVSIENSIDINLNHYYEVCNIVIYQVENKYWYRHMYKVYLDKRIEELKKYLNESLAKSREEDYEFLEFGFSTTIGSIVAKENDGYDKADWIGHFNTEGITRVMQIDNALKEIKQKLIV